MTMDTNNSHAYFNDEQLQNQAANAFLKAEDWLSVRSNEPESQYIRSLFDRFKDHKSDDKKTLRLVFGTTPGQLKIVQRNLLFLDAVKLLRKPEDRSYFPACGLLVKHLDRFRNPAYALCKQGSREFKNDLEIIMFKILEIDHRVKTLRQDSIYKIVRDLINLDE